MQPGKNLILATDFDEQGEYYALRHELRKRIEIADTAEQDFTSLYKSDIEKQVDKSIANSV